MKGHKYTFELLYCICAQVGRYIPDKCLIFEIGAIPCSPMCIESCALSKMGNMRNLSASLSVKMQDGSLDLYIFDLTMMILGLFHAWVYFALDFDLLFRC